MKSIIHGTLRFLLAIGGIYMFCQYFSENHNISTFFRSASRGEIAAVYVVLQLISCFVLYMAINGVRDFMHKRIRMRVMYVINTLLFLSIVLFGIFGKSDGKETNDPPSDWDFLYGLALLAIIYFTVYDFIALFIKRKNHIEKRRMEFETDI